MALPMSEFCRFLDRFTERVPLPELTEKLAMLDVDLVQLAEHLKFGIDRYQRNLYRAGPAYHALILCWRSGQRSPIHDHRGSSCAVRVLSGVATESLFA